MEQRYYDPALRRWLTPDPTREFDQHGNPVRDIDFTDHDRPQKHPNPHQHEHLPNPTGGTPERSKNPEPVTGWNY